jgi:ADP-heptose:LPS heptosyltransferase
VTKASDPPSPASSRSSAEQRAIVLLHADEALGDALVNVAMYRALRLAFPDHRIVGLYSKDSAFRTTLSRVREDFVDEIRVGQPIKSRIDLTRAVLKSVGCRIDVLIETRPNIRALWSLIASAGLIRAFIPNSPAYFPVLGVWSLPQLRPRHAHHRRHRLVELATGRVLPFDPSLPEQPDAAARAAELLPSGRDYVAIAPGPAASQKYWPTPLQREFAARLVSAGITPVYLLGPYEADHRQWIEASAPGAVVIGPPEANEDSSYLPWLIHAAAGRCRAAVAVEGGLGHLIASRGGPLLTLAGPTNAMRWKPVTDLWWVLRAQSFGSDRMEAIPVDAVMKSVDEMLAWGERPGARPARAALASS